jgi:hypothetical protein
MRDEVEPGDIGRPGEQNQHFYVRMTLGQFGCVIDTATSSTSGDAPFVDARLSQQKLVRSIEIPGPFFV